MRPIIFFLTLLLLLLSKVAQAAQTKTGFCTNMTLEQIPIGNFQAPRVAPIAPLRITQEYNTSLSEGFCQAPGQPSGSSTACKGKTIYYGHDGLDLHPQGAAAGVNNIYAVQPALVIASHANGSYNGWGESIILVTRTSAYSEELLTFNYHHLFVSATRQTSRLKGPCELVALGDVLAKEGGTPNWPTHLHFGIKRWKNLAELKEFITKKSGLFYGYGYVFSDSSKLSNFLDPKGYLFDNFEDLQPGSPYLWVLPFAREMRDQGWYFGSFSGDFGVTETVKRREAARLLKQALNLPNNLGKTATFIDLPLTDPDSPYLETLLRLPAPQPFSPDSSCAPPTKRFCPDLPLKRAEAIKMIVSGFYRDQFIDFYQNWVWNVAPDAAKKLLSKYTDIVPGSWYAPYVYFAWQKGLLGSDALFRPTDPVQRGELAKWLVLSYQTVHQTISTFCHSKICPNSQYCDAIKQQCQLIPTCVPNDSKDCPLGGGFVEQSPSSPIYTCQSDPKLGLTCYKGVGICLSSGKMVCSASNEGVECDAPLINPNPLGEICNNSLDDNCNGGADEQPCVSQGTGSGGSGSSSGGAGAGYGGSGSSSGCSSKLIISPSVPSCYYNKQASGSPLLCLETKQLNASKWQWRVCKNGGVFQNNFTYQLLDQNHLSQYLGFYQSTAGSSCSSWQSSDFGYIQKNGSANGAGLLIEVHSPSGCTSSACTYKTGIATLYRVCQLIQNPVVSSRQGFFKYIRVALAKLWSKSFHQHNPNRLLLVIPYRYV